MQAYNQIDQQIHQLSQLIAKANRTFVSKEADDSHTNLCYEAASHRLLGRWIEAAEQKVILALNLEVRQFEWLNEKQEVIQNVQIVGSTSEQIEEQLVQGLPGLGLGTDGFGDPLHFEIPDYGFGNIPFEAFDLVALKDWEQFRELANQACERLMEDVHSKAEVRIWPHHFDTGIYVEANKDIGLGFGLAMEDAMVGGPYFYFSGYGLNGYELNYNAVAELSAGRWIVGDQWNGAVLPLEELSVGDLETVNSFAAQVSRWFLGN